MQAASAADDAARMEKVMSDPALRAEAAKAGQKAAFFCANCHGEHGISVLDNIPNMAGQNATYLLNQIQKFGDGRRRDEFMSGLVKVLKPEDRFNMAIFYALQPVPPTPAKNARLIEAGHKQYLRACQGCHGPEAKGSKEIARLAGQRTAYLSMALSQYRAAKGLRTDVRMTSVCKDLQDADIAALASYLASLR